MDTMISVDALVDLISDIAGKSITKHHDLSKPQGVRGRNSDNSLLRTLLEWEPTISLRKGLSVTYSWIQNEILNQKTLSQ
jgi:nucleoside-diphosphate-sugar epimerase